ncbi:unnamed protein product [Caenorhabditis nigoni]
MAIKTGSNPNRTCLTRKQIVTLRKRCIFIKRSVSLSLTMIHMPIHATFDTTTYELRRLRLLTPRKSS